MQELISFFKKRLQLELPHSDIRKEGLDPKLLALLLKEESNTGNKFRKTPPNICAVMVAFYPDKDGIYLPMMLRPSKSRVHAGEIAFPGGKKEDQDENLIETAIREMEEEIGVRVPVENILGALSPIYIPPSNALVTPIIGFLESKPAYVPAPDEVERVLDVSIADLRNPVNGRLKKVILTNGEYIHMPAYKVNDVLIWGGTARMIVELNKLLAEMEG